MFKQIRHLLPRARAWDLTADKTIRRFFEGLGNSLCPPPGGGGGGGPLAELDDGTELNDGTEMGGPSASAGIATPGEYLDSVQLNLYPGTTQSLTEYEGMLGALQVTYLSDVQRRQRLAVLWSALGGQSPSYIQNLVQDYGFTDVYIHEWWDPVTEAVRDPNAFIDDPEFQLINLRQIIGPNVVRAGAGFRAGDGISRAGAADGIASSTDSKFIPSDPAAWPFFVYFGGQTFGTYATVPVERRYEFERLLLRTCPAHLWIGLRINFT